MSLGDAIEKIQAYKEDYNTAPAVRIDPERGA
jgi:hypothetical protein